MYGEQDLIEQPVVIPGSIGAMLFETEQRLRYAEVLRPRRHAELLVETATGLNRIQLYLNASRKIEKPELAVLNSLVLRREAGEPVQYISGWAPFYGREFKVGEGVFIPRFETEILIEQLMKTFTANNCSRGNVEILDLCCGCGILGLTAAYELPQSNVTLIDLSETALEYCRINAESLGVQNRTAILQRDALKQFPEEWNQRFNFVLANPPYIALDQVVSLPRDVRDGEPHTALTDGDDGFSFYRDWRRTIPQILNPEYNRVFFECGDNGAEKVERILCEVFSDITITRDLSGMERVVDASFRKKQVTD